MKYKIPSVWQMYGVMEIQAENLDEAIEKAHDAALPDGDYLQDSFEVDEASLEYHNDNGIEI